MTYKLQLTQSLAPPSDDCRINLTLLDNDVTVDEETLRYPLSDKISVDELYRAIMRFLAQLLGSSNSVSMWNASRNEAELYFADGVDMDEIVAYLQEDTVSAALRRYLLFHQIPYSPET